MIYDLPDNIAECSCRFRMAASPAGVDICTISDIKLNHFIVPLLTPVWFDGFLEVKSGAGGSLRSLHLMLEAYPNCPIGLVLYDGTYSNRPEQKLLFLPLYAASTIGNRRLDSFPVIE